MCRNPGANTRRILRRSGGAVSVTYWEWRSREDGRCADMPEMGFLDTSPFRVYCEDMTYDSPLTFLSLALSSFISARLIPLSAPLYA